MPNDDDGAVGANLCVRPVWERGRVGEWERNLAMMKIYTLFLCNDVTRRLPVTLLSVFLLFIAGCATTRTVSFMTYQPPDYDISLIKTITILGFDTSKQEIGNSVKSQLVHRLMQHGYFTVVEPDRATSGYADQYIDSVVDAGRQLGVDAVIDGKVIGDVEDRYTTQKNTKRVLTRYKTVVEYESRPVVETIKVRVKEKGKWVEKTKKVTTVKRVPKKKKVPVYERVAYTEKYLNRKGSVTVTLRVIDMTTGNILASRNAARSQDYRKLISSNEPPARRVSGNQSIVGGLLTAILDAAVEGSIDHRTRGTMPGQSEIIQTLSSEVARELADQLSPRQISIVRQLKLDKLTKTGINLARNGQWDQAGREWRRAHDRDPDNSAVWNNLGVYYEHTGQYAEAQHAYEQAAERHSRERIYRQNLGALMSMVEAMRKQTAALGAKIEETSLGLLVASVLEGTLAERLGLRKGDIIDRVNQKDMATYDELERAIIHTTKLGVDLTVEVIRAGELVALNLALGDSPGRVVTLPQPNKPETSTMSFEPVVDVDQVIPSNIHRPDALGIILGIEDYRYAPSVPYARHDAMVAHEYFVRALGIKESNIYMRTDRDATQGEFRKVFDPERGWLAKRIKPKKTEVFVYFVGHGVPDIKTRNSYLVPSDGDPNYPATSFRLDELYRSLNQLPAQQITVILDACFSGQVGRGDRVEMLLADARGIAVESRYVELEPHLVVLTAAQGNQVSSSYPEKSHGLFTYYVFKGLKGHADQNSDSEITIRELYAYVRERVMEQAGYLDREQTPEIQGEDLDRVLVRY